MKYLNICFILIVISACSNESVDEMMDFEIFDNQKVNFKDSEDINPEIIRMDSGRVVLKKINLPMNNDYLHASANIRLISTGDPWDKSGSFFIIPPSSDYSLIDLKNKDFPSMGEENDPHPAIKKFFNEDKQYFPPLELLRFITPFGVGYFNTQECCEKLKPVYIAKWEEDISWSEDISHLIPILKGEITVGVFVDTWSEKGWEIDANIVFSEPLEKRPKRASNIVSLVNTTPISTSQNGYDKFATKPLAANFELEKDADVVLYYLTTGHGGHGTGDEFVKKINRVSLNGDLVEEYTPWRDDCASYRRFNPSSGVWSETTEWKGEPHEERIASSDYSRSGWCPGSLVSPKRIDLGRLEKGVHEISISIPKAQVTTETEFNFWNVAAYITY